MSFETNYVFNQEDYTRELGNYVKVDASKEKSDSIKINKLWPFSFSASSSYQEIYKSTKIYEEKFTSNAANCHLYCVSGLTFVIRPLSENFIIAVNTLTEDLNDPNYYLFLEVFGTHYIHSMDMGSSYFVLTRFKSENWKTLNSRTSEVKTAASISALIKVGVDVSDKEKIELAKEFKSHSENTIVHAIGGILPSSGKIEDWIPNALANPMPLGYKIKSIDEILTKKYFPNDILIEIKRKNLLKSIENYCFWLKERGEIENCDEEKQIPEKALWKVYSCPVGKYRCFGQLSPYSSCVELEDSSIHGREEESFFECKELTLTYPIVYSCPLISQGLWHPGFSDYSNCRGQLSLSQTCFIQESGHRNFFSCEEFDITKEKIYKCPENYRQLFIRDPLNNNKFIDGDQLFKGLRWSIFRSWKLL